MSEAPKGPAVKALTCPVCGAPVELRAAGSTVSVACASCGSTLDALAPDLALIKRAQGLASKPRIPLGTRGKLDGVDWDVTGYLERVAGDGRWSEYLLFNPYYGYRFLVDDRRNWSLGKLLDSPPKGYGTKLLGGDAFELFEESYRATTRFVLGEFYWRVTEGESVRMADYVRPGAMLCSEQAEDEITWTRLEILPRGEVEKAFRIDERFLRAGRPSPHEPSPWGSYLKPLWLTAGLAMAALLFLVFFQPRQQGLAAVSMIAYPEVPEETKTVANIDLHRDYNRVVVRAWGEGLDNQWIDSDLSLVNQKTQQSYDAYASPEYYSGRDSDGPWTEGATVKDVVFSHVPKGRYDLVVDYSAHTWAGSTYSPAAYSAVEGAPTVFNQRPPPLLGVDVWEGGMQGANFNLAWIAILLIPGLVTWRHIAFERRRKGED